MQIIYIQIYIFNIKINKEVQKSYIYIINKELHKSYKYLKKIIKKRTIKIIFVFKK
jgi:hypothetical protein